MSENDLTTDDGDGRSGSAKGTPEHIIVGVGSSAGGLEAIRDLARSLSPEINASFIIAQHMAPQHMSQMTSLVASETVLPVRDVKSGEPPRRGHIYITPPNHDVIVKDGLMVLCAPSPEAASPKPSIDRFFISLAEDQGEKAVAVVLSGTGSDGAYGIQVTRGLGGITIAQDDATAKYDGMPNAAVGTGCVDLILSPRDIGLHLARILESAEELEGFRNRERISAPLTDLMQILMARTRVDFNEYKPSTVQRRIERRMLALGITDLEAYIDFCRSSPEEVDMLFKDLLISVTRFFRDRNEFKELAPVIEEIVRDKQGAGIRIWAAGVATGEEAYSIAMLVAEALGGPMAIGTVNVQIFATDLDDRALKMARDGNYPLAALADVPKELIEKYFSIKGATAQVITPLRDMILFARHNICTDPPIVKLDLVVCRNLLIYFRTGLQRKVLSRLHYSLLPRGALFLGTAETVLAAEELFVQLPTSAHIYRRRLLPNGRGGTNLKEAIARPGRGTRTGMPLGNVSADDGQARAARALFDGLARSVGPNSVIVTEDHRIVRIIGDMSEIISLRENAQPSLTTRLLVEPFDREAQTLVTLSLKHGERRAGIVHRDYGGAGRCLQLEAFPIIAEPGDRVVLLSLRAWFEDAPSTLSRQLDISHSDDATRAHLNALESELAATREALQQMVEELETSNEELQSLNEELQSANEELQATNEELETSNEELQSTNEELVTVNEELQINSAELSNITSELESVLGNLGVAILAVDAALQVRHVNEAALELFSWEKPSINTHLSQLQVPSQLPNLSAMCAETTRTGLKIERDLLLGQRSFHMRCSPFYNEVGQIRGSTMVFADTSDANYANELRHILDHAGIEILHRTLDGDILRASGLLAENLGLTRAEVEGRNLRDLMSKDEFETYQEKVLAFVESGEKSMTGGAERFRNKGGKERLMLVHRTRYDEAEGRPPTTFSFRHDITEIVRVRDIAARARLMESMQSLTNAGFHILDLETGQSEYSKLLLDLLGYPREELDSETIAEWRDQMYVGDELAFVKDVRKRAFAEDRIASFAMRARRRDGAIIPLQCRSRKIVNPETERSHVVTVFWPLPESAIDDLPYEGIYAAITESPASAE